LGARELVWVDLAELEAAAGELRDRFAGLGELLPFCFLHREGMVPRERKPILAYDEMPYTLFKQLKALAMCNSRVNSQQT